MLFGELQTLLLRDLSIFSFVHLVAYQDGGRMVVAVLFDLFKPESNIFEAIVRGEVKNNDDAMSSSAYWKVYL